MRLSNLYETRKQEWTRTTLRYTKLAANSGFMFSLYMALMIGGVYYQKALKSLPPHFPAALILTIWFTVFVVPSSIRTYIQSADLIFLLPAEAELSNYFRKAIKDSWIRQSLVLVFVAAVGMPLYLKAIDPNASHYGVVLVLLILLKAWNVFGVWCEARTQVRSIYAVFRFLISISFIYLILIKVSWPLIGILLLVFIGYSWFAERPLLINEPLNWVYLAEEESRQAMRILRLANWVTDVPGLVLPTKPRAYLNFIASVWNGKGKKSVYPLLYYKTFSRAGDYFGLFSRLTIVGAVLIVIVRASLILALVVFGLSLFLTAFQLLTLKRHDFPLALEGLYPIEPELRNTGFLQVTRLLMGVQTVILSLVFLLVTYEWTTGLIMLILGFILSIGWIQILSRKKTEVV